MVHKIHKIAIVTDDIEGAVKFYTQKLGLTVVERFHNEDDEDYVFLDAGGITLELMPQKSMGLPPSFHHISFKVDSVEDSAQELKDKGVTITKEPFDVGGGTGITLGFFEGPNQLNLQLFHREK
ncbi:MAG: VOC family protein [Gemmatimonadetes bacterium]|nr:VOC family protein [Gemmatimonadota bacterium]MYK39231.1 VOC family protein [Gemmatimonadota bacterium]